MGTAPYSAHPELQASRHWAHQDNSLRINVPSRASGVSRMVVCELHQSTTESALLTQCIVSAELAGCVPLAVRVQAVYIAVLRNTGTASGTRKFSHDRALGEQVPCESINISNRKTTIRLTPDARRRKGARQE
jgi:hypothetical protein